MNPRQAGDDRERDAKMNLNYPDNELAEVKLFRAILELNHRILHTPTLDERTALRSAVSVLRTELIKLLDALRIPSEDEVKRAQSDRPPYLVPLPRQ